MAVEFEEPVAVGSVPVVLVAVEDDGGVVADAVATQQRLERRLVDEVALGVVLHIGMPVEFDGIVDMAEAS